MDDNGVNGSDPLQELEAGIEQWVRIGRKGMLEHAMDVLGAPAPEYTVVECDPCVKVSIKLDLSSLISSRGERISYSVVEGVTSINPANAESTAILKALNHLENNQMIKIFDFSSRATSILDSCKINDLLLEGIGCIEKLFVNWDKIAVKLKDFTVDLLGKKLIDYFGGPLTPNGTVYAVLSEYLDSIQSNLDAKATELLEDFADIKADRCQLEEKLQQRGDLNQIHGPYREVVLPSKSLLDHVLSFYGLENAEYTNSPDPFGKVRSKATFEFPYLENFKYGGKLAIRGHGYNSDEADEEAAYNSLLFIEKNFRTHIVDYNYTKLKKARKAKTKFMLMLSRIIELGDSVRMMFGEFTNAIQGQLMKFSFEPTSFLSGPVAAGQIEAYYFCANGLKDLEQHSAQCYADCEVNFDVLHKLIWKLTAAQTNLPM